MMVEVIGHRGARGLLPELSLPGFEKAIDLGVDSLELDVGISSDHSVVIYHDYRLNPAITRESSVVWVTAPGPRLCDLTVAELKTYDVGRIDSDTAYAREFRSQTPVDGARIPTLSELADLVKRRNFEGPIYIEVKRSPANPQLTVSCETFAGVLAAEIQRLGIVSAAIVESFDWNVLKRIQKIDPSISISPITSEQPGIDNVSAETQGVWTGGPTLADFGNCLVKLVESCGGKTWCSDCRDLTEERVAKAKNSGLKVVAWTVNETDDMVRLMEIGVDGIVTDYPDRLINLLSQGK